MCTICPPPPDSMLGGIHYPPPPIQCWERLDAQTRVQTNIEWGGGGVKLEQMVMYVHWIQVNGSFPIKKRNRYQLFASNISMLPIFHSSKLMVFVWQKNTYLHLVQIIWNNLVVLFYLSVHTDVSISCLFLCTYTSKYFHNVHYFPPSVSSFLPQSVVLKKYIRAIQCVQYSTSSTAQWGRTSLKCWKTHWCWSDTGFLIAVVSKGTPLHKWLVLKGLNFKMCRKNGWIKFYGT